MSDRRLQAENLHVWRGERHVLCGLSMQVEAGECVEVTGRNGAGKTSLLRTLAGLLIPETGRVSWCGADIQADRGAFWARAAYIGHDPPLKADLTAGENLRYWVSTRQRVAGGAISASLERFGVGACAERAARTLSAGQRRRVALAGLALMEVPLWLLDEPTTHLDVDGQRLVAALIDQQLARGGLVVAAVHQGLGLTHAGARQLELSTRQAAAGVALAPSRQEAPLAAARLGLR